VAGKIIQSADAGDEGARVRERQLRRRCRDLLHELDIRPPLDFAELRRRRGRPLRLVLHPIPVPGPSSAWTATANADYVLYQQQTTRAHHPARDRHVIAGHPGDEHDDERLRSLFPDLAPGAARRALRRTSYDTGQEREAEMVATIILQRAPVLDAVVSRLSARSPNSACKAPCPTDSAR